MLETTTEPASLPTAGGEGRPLQEACKLAIFSTSTFAWPVVRYVLPENSNDTLRGLLCRRHRTSSPDRRCRRGETRLEACQDPCRPRGLRVPKASSSILSLRIIGRSGAELAPLLSTTLCTTKLTGVFPLQSGGERKNGRKHWRARDHVSDARSSFAEAPYYYFRIGGGRRTRGGRGREIEREKARGEETGAPPSNPLLDSSPALDCSIATTRGMLSTTATKCAEEIPMLSSPLTPSPLAPSPPTDGPALFTRCTRGSLAFAAITTDHFSMD